MMRAITKFQLGCFSLALLLPMALPLAAAAQDFQAPTSEELTMTSDPKAPGAAAVYLYLEERVDDNLHYHSYYARIKVLTEKGKSLATVEVPYQKRYGGESEDRITLIYGRTIHADGTIVPLKVKPADLLYAEQAKEEQINKVVFTLPSVEVGSILEYRWQLQYQDGRLSSPDWLVQQPYYVHKAHYVFTPYKFRDEVLDGRGQPAGNLLYINNLGDKGKVIEDAAGKFTLDVADIAPIPEEEDMPPVRSLMGRVTFYYSPYPDAGSFWMGEGKHVFKDIDHFANVNAAIKQAVGNWTTPSDSEEAKARKLYEAVMKLENTDFTRKKSKDELKSLGLKRAKEASDILSQKAGSSDEIAMLYLALVRGAGLTAWPVRIVDRNHAIFNPAYLSTWQLDDTLVAVTIAGKEMIVDPGERYCPFGSLHWIHADAGGIRETQAGVSSIVTAGISYKEAGTVRDGVLRIDEHGNVTGSVRYVMTGPEALRWRQLALENDEEEVKKQFNEELSQTLPDGVQGDFSHFLGLDDYNTYLIAIVNVTGAMGSATGKRVFLPGLFFESHGKLPFVQEANRQTAVDMHYASTYQDTVTYNIPETFTVESAPTETTIPWPQHAVLKIKSTVDGHSVKVNRTFAVGFTLLSGKEYPVLHDYYQKIATADQQQVVLIAAPKPATAGASPSGAGR